MKRYERIMEEHPEIKAWLKNRPWTTQKEFASRLKDFCNAMKVEPEEWRHMDKFEARDLAWKYVEPKIKEQSSVAMVIMAALKSWYRNLNGETLPFDSGRGGKHNFRIVPKKAIFEKVPSKKEVYRIVDMASSLRDKALLLTLFQSGIRVNALCSLKYGHIAEQLNSDIIDLKITWELDDKLRGTNIPFYFTFVNGEGVVTLRQYCKLKHGKRDLDAPLFYTRRNKPITKQWVWKIVKMCITRAGFERRTMWVHSFRKAFRKVVRQANIDDDDKEQLMGHVIRGSRQAYFDRKDVALIKKAYLKCNFAREVPESEVTKLRKQLEDEQSKRMLNEMRLEKLERELEGTRKLLQQMLEKKV